MLLNDTIAAFATSSALQGMFFYIGLKAYFYVGIFSLEISKDNLHNYNVTISLNKICEAIL